MSAYWALWKSAAVGFPVCRICSLPLQLDPPESVTVLWGWDGRVSDLVLQQTGLLSPLSVVAPVLTDVLGPSEHVAVAILSAPC